MSAGSNNHLKSFSTASDDAAATETFGGFPSEFGNTIVIAKVLKVEVASIYEQRCTNHR